MGTWHHMHMLTHMHPHKHHLTNLTFACRFLGLTVWFAVLSVNARLFLFLFLRIHHFLSSPFTHTHVHTLSSASCASGSDFWHNSVSNAEVPMPKTDKEAFLHLPSPFSLCSLQYQAVCFCVDVCIRQPGKSSGRMKRLMQAFAQAFCSLWLFLPQSLLVVNTSTASQKKSASPPPACRAVWFTTRRK